MNMTFKKLTNVRAPKTNNPEIIATVTPSLMRMSDSVAEKLGIDAGDYVGLVEAGDTVYVYKGGEGAGAKLSRTNKTTGTIQFSGSNPWSTLGGTIENHRVFSVDLDNPLQNEDTAEFLKSEGLEDAPLYSLEFVRTEEKSERKSKDDVEEGGQEDAENDMD